MPTFDGGHCFLTALLPIKTEEVVDHDGQRSSPVHMVREALAILATARQSPVTQTLPVSPFAKCLKTHFLRMAVIDDTIYNGRIATDAILDRSDRTVPKPVDQLLNPYLMLVVDFDAPDGSETELRDYLRYMWTEMRSELDPIFSQCFGYAQKATSADGFADYVIACQLETTMPFNDYWAGAPQLASLSMASLIGIGGGTAFAAAVVLYAALSSMGFIPGGHGWGYWGGIVLTFAPFGLAAGAYALYRLVMSRGAKPFPMAPNSDLPSILKALYLQRELIGFAIRQQGASPEDLYKGFGSFLKMVRVDNLLSPAQLPGTIKP